MADITKINGTPLSTFGAALLAYNSGTISLKDNYFKAENRLRMTILPSRLPLRDITVKFEFIGDTDHEAEENASIVVQTLAGETELLLPDGYTYRCTLTKTAKPNRISEGIFQREFSLIGYRHGEKETVVVASSGTNIAVKGNYKAETKFTCVASAGTVTVNGITVSNVTVGATIVIDGINCFVTQNGVNKFDDSNITEFPTVSIGTQQITFLGTASVTVEYYPIFY